MMSCDERIAGHSQAALSLDVVSLKPFPSLDAVSLGALLSTSKYCLPDVVL